MNYRQHATSDYTQAIVYNPAKGQGDNRKDQKDRAADVATQQGIEFRSSHTRQRTLPQLTPGQEYRVGSGEDNDVVLQGTGVLEHHAWLMLAEGGLDIALTGDAPVSVNGRPIQGPATSWIRAE